MSFRNMLMGSIGILALLVMLWALFANLPLTQNSVTLEGNVDVLATGYPMPTDEPYPVGTTSPRMLITEAPNKTPTPTPTPLPTVVGVLHGTQTQELSLHGLSSNITRLFEYDVYGDFLFAVAHLTDGTSGVVKINLLDGQTEMVLAATDGETAYWFSQLSVSDSYIAWLDTIPNTAENIIQVYDWQQDSLHTIQQDNVRQLHVNSHFVIWSSVGTTGLNLHDLSTGETTTILQASDSKRFPTICSDNWIAYLHNLSSDGGAFATISADLSIYNLATDEEQWLGTVHHVPNIPSDRNFTYACDTDKIMWVSPIAERAPSDDEPSVEIFMYDFAVRSHSQVNLDAQFRQFGSGILVNDEILIKGNIGYDLQEDAPFSVQLDYDSRPGQRLLANNKVVWINSSEFEDRPHIYVIELVEGGSQ